MGSNAYAMSTLDGYTSREVVFDQYTTLRLYTQLNGVTDTPVSVSLIISKGGTTLNIGNADGDVGYGFASISPDDLSSIGVQLYDKFEGHWTITFSDGAVKRYTETLFVADDVIEPPILLSHITDRYQELKQSNSLTGSGETNWYFMVKSAWRDCRNWLDGQTEDRRIWKNRNIQSYSELLREWTLQYIAEYQDAKQNGSRVWEDRAKKHSDRVKELKATTLSYFAQSKINNWGESPTTDKMTVKAPKFFTGMSSQYGWGKR